MGALDPGPGTHTLPPCSRCSGEGPRSALGQRTEGWVLLLPSPFTAAPRDCRSPSEPPAGAGDVGLGVGASPGAQAGMEQRRQPLSPAWGGWWGDGGWSHEDCHPRPYSSVLWVPRVTTSVLAVIAQPGRGGWWPGSSSTLPPAQCPPGLQLGVPLA